jgi:hypothetical protein
MYSKFWKQGKAKTMTRTAKNFVSPREPEKFFAALEAARKATSPKALAQNAEKAKKEGSK